MTWMEDALMSQCLQRHVTEVDVSRRGAGRTCLMFVVFLRRMMSTLQWSSLETNVSSQLTCCCSVTLLLRSVAWKCCSSQVSLCHLTRCLVCYIRNGARSVPRKAQTKSVSQHPCTDSVPSCVVIARVARTTLRGSWVHTSRKVAERLVILH